MQLPPQCLAGDCIEQLAALPAASVDAVVCDPPYGLKFMGVAWDTIDGRDGDGQRRDTGERMDKAGGNHNPVDSADAARTRASENRKMQEWHERWAREALRVLKPGGHLLAFGGTRTYHRLACAIEDTGFEIRDTIAWLYGSGFPKSLDVSKAIDKAAGAERDVMGLRTYGDGQTYSGGAASGRSAGHMGNIVARQPSVETAPATPEAQRWEGWGTALKPAHEPVVVARKPLTGTVAANVLEHGTGALNVDGCRIGFRDEADERESKDKNRHADFGSGPRDNKVYGSDDRARGENGNYDAPGRWPANVLLDPEAAELLDAQTGELGASRFMYVAKASRAERNAGLDGFEEQVVKQHAQARNNGSGGLKNGTGDPLPIRNHHPTVKPIALMRWLVRLVTPPGGTVLDPFTGSGTTGIAAVLEGFDFIGIEREPEYVAIAAARIAFWAEHGVDGLRIVRERELSEERQRELSELGQLDLFGEPA